MIEQGCLGKSAYGSFLVDAGSVIEAMSQLKILQINTIITPIYICPSGNKIYHLLYSPNLHQQISRKNIFNAHFIDPVQFIFFQVFYDDPKYTIIIIQLILTQYKNLILGGMPQLPEVETVRRFLTQVLLKPKPKKIKHIFTYYPTIIKEPEPAEFTKILIGQTFEQIDRYGKFLILKLKNYSIISHLRMEGKYNFYASRPEIGKHDHIEFVMTDGSALVYSDVRKFGTMHLVKKGEEMQHKSLAKLGPQANQPDFTPQYLHEICQKRTSSIKQLLLDQDSVCGIGNIYADEILYSSGIHPETSSKSIPENKLQAIVKSSKYILDKAIINKGTTFRSFSSNHQSGEFQNCIKVYDRAGQKCQNCGHNIQKIKVGGRGTHFCPKCQLKTF